MLPVQRKTRAQGGKRRSHDALKIRQSVACPQCSSDKLPHSACMSCGYVRPGLRIHVPSDQD